jgi:uncharacterized short protein YbdD (DUF466 family)
MKPTQLTTLQNQFNALAQQHPDEPVITREHVQNNTSVRQMLGERGI